MVVVCLSNTPLAVVKSVISAPLLAADTLQDCLHGLTIPDVFFSYEHMNNKQSHIHKCEILIQKLLKWDVMRGVSIWNDNNNAL